MNTLCKLFPPSLGDLGGVELIANYCSSTGSTSNAMQTYPTTFSKDYKYVLVFITSHDSDNNSDNYYAVYDTDKSWNWSNKAGMNSDNDGKWLWIKPVLPSGTSYPGTNAYYNDFDKNKEIMAGHNSSGYIFECLAYKENVKAGETAYITVQSYWTSVTWVIGVNP